MSFNKKFLNATNLTYLYEIGGALRVFKEISAPDTLLSTDELSRKIIEHTHLPKEELMKKIDELLLIEE